MAKGYEQVVQALRQVGAAELDKVRSSFSEHSNWLAGAVAQAREQILALRSQSGDPVGESSHAGPEDVSVKALPRATRARARRGGAALASIEEEEEAPGAKEKEKPEQPRVRRTRRQRGVAVAPKEGATTACDADAPPPAPVDQAPADLDTEATEADAAVVRPAAARRGRPPRAPKGRRKVPPPIPAAEEEAQPPLSPSKAEVPASVPDGELEVPQPCISQDKPDSPPPQRATRGRGKAKATSQAGDLAAVPPQSTRAPRSRRGPASEDAVCAAADTPTAEPSGRRGRQLRSTARKGTCCEATPTVTPAGVSEGPSSLPLVGTPALSVGGPVSPIKVEEQPPSATAVAEPSSKRSVRKRGKQGAASINMDGELSGVAGGDAHVSALDAPCPEVGDMAQQHAADVAGVDKGHIAQDTTSSVPDDVAHAGENAAVHIASGTPVAEAPSPPPPGPAPQTGGYQQAECTQVEDGGAGVPVGDERGSAQALSVPKEELASHPLCCLDGDVPGISSSAPPTSPTGARDTDAIMPTQREREGPPSSNGTVSPRLQSAMSGGFDEGLQDQADASTVDSVLGMPDMAMDEGSSQERCEEGDGANSFPPETDGATPACGVQQDGGVVQPGNEQAAACIPDPPIASPPAEASPPVGTAAHDAAGPPPASQKVAADNCEVELPPKCLSPVTCGPQLEGDSPVEPAHLARDCEDDAPPSREGVGPPPAVLQEKKAGGLGANLVSTVRSFLPFVSSLTADTAAACAAGKAQVKVKALEAAEAAKKKEAAKAAQRARLKEEMERQKAERTKVRDEEQQDDAQRRKEMLLKKDEEAAARRRAKELADKREREEKAKRLEQMRAKAAQHTAHIAKVVQAEANDKEADRKRKAPMTQQDGGAKKVKMGPPVLPSTLHHPATAALRRDMPSLHAPAVASKELQEHASATQSANAQQAPCTLAHGQARPPLPAPPAAVQHASRSSGAVQSYEISPYRTDADSDSEDDDDNPRKPIPEWARGRTLLSQLMAQTLIDPDEVFQQHSTSCTLDAVFGHSDKEKGTKKDLSRRGSSGNWIEDRVTWKEEMSYKKAMGYL